MKNLLKILGVIILIITMSFTGSKKTIVIDVGHGGKDNGVEINGATEKEIVLNIANKMKELNKESDVDIVLTRNSDEFVSIEEKTEFINSLNPDYVVSLHINSSKNEKRNGFDFFVSKENKFNEKSSELALKFKNSLSKNVSINEIQNANFHILKNVNCPAIHIEMGYFSNQNDREILKSDEGQTRIAKMLYEAIK